MAQPVAPAVEAGRRSHINVVSWNPCSLAEEGRMEEIDQEFRNTDIVILTGTGRKAMLDLPSWQQQLPHHKVHHVGWSRKEEYSNKSAGVAIMLGKRLFRGSHTLRYDLGPQCLAGRALSIRAKGPTYDYMIVAAYFPPQGSMPKGKWRKAVDLLLTWVAKQLREAPHRCTPIIGLDLNDEMGLTRDAHGLHETTSGSVGTPFRRPEAYVGTKFRELLELEQLAAVNTFGRPGAKGTYFSEGGSSSRIDFLVIPQSLLGSVRTCRVLEKEAKRLQLIRDSKPRDHRPILMQVEVVLDFSPILGDKLVRWSQDALMAAWHRGEGRDAFLQEVEEKCAEKEDRWRDTSARSTPDVGWEELIDDIRDIARKYFETKHEPNLRRKEQEQRRRQLLVERMRLRESRTSEGGGNLGEVQEELKVLTNLLKNERRLQDRRRRSWAVYEMQEAERRQDHAVVHRMVRVLAGKGRGPKKRVYKAPPTQCPTAEEWRQVLSGQGTDGGMMAHFVEDWDEEQKEYEESAPPLPAWTLSSAQKAREDMEGTADKLVKMMKRRASPSWSLPTEIFCMLMRPGHRRKKLQRGVGIGAQGVGHVQTPMLEQRLRSVLTQVRRAGATPLVAHRSHPCLLRKKLYDPKALPRMIHVLCPFWRAWHGQMGDSSVDNPADNEYGFVRHRRREGAVLVQMNLSHRLGKADKSHIRCLYDATNAFASTYHESLAEFADVGLDVEESAFMETRRVNAQIWLDTPTGDLVAVPGCGALMGDSRAPVDFRRAYKPGLDKWHEEMGRWGTSHTKAHLDLGGSMQGSIDLSTTVFADDLARTQVVKAPAEATRYIGEADTALGRCLGSQGHSQNAAKKVIMPHFKKRSERWHFASLQASAKGKASVDARYLGSTLSIFRLNKPERAKRVQAVRAAWASLGRFWTSNAPLRQKRQVFLSQVMGSAVSGLAAFVLGQEDCRPLDKLIAKYLKVMLKGKATWVTEGGLRTLSHEKLRFYWRIPRVATEARVHRVKWLQSMAVNPQHHKQVLAALWGRLGPAGPEQLTPEGVTRTGANPWALQLERDLEEFSKLEGWCELLAEARTSSGGISIKKLFECGFAERFCSSDAGQLRQAELSREVPPPCWDREEYERQQDQQEGPASGEAVGRHEEHSCFDCGATFASLRACRAHSRKLHGHRKLIHMCTLSNQCPWCSSTFASKHIAARHAENAYLRGVCKADAALWPYAAEPAGRTDCPICQQQFEEQDSLFFHIRQHLPLPPPDLEFSFGLDEDEGGQQEGPPPIGGDEGGGAAGGAEEAEGRRRGRGRRRSGLRRRSAGSGGRRRQGQGQGQEEGEAHPEPDRGGHPTAGEGSLFVYAERQRPGGGPVRGGHGRGERAHPREDEGGDQEVAGGDGGEGGQGPQPRAALPPSMGGFARLAH